MKLLLSLLLCSVSIQCFSQASVFKISQNYFRVDPFTNPYSNFVKGLMTDAALDTQQVSKRTDTTLFYFTGKYKTYNPFFFKPAFTEIILAETEATDSTGGIIYIYQLIAHSKNDKDGQKDVVSEFEKLNRKYGKGFTDDQLRTLKNGDEKSAVIHDYKIDNTDYIPMSIAWATKKETDEVILVLTLRFRVENNICFLPKSFN